MQVVVSSARAITLQVTDIKEGKPLHQLQRSACQSPLPQWLLAWLSALVRGE